ncbi:MAG: AMP-binding acetyl-CoA synthetase [Nevskia sp.]|nr:AMP-binding acetyl-CoA synthetase [Nevskia sp.]
MVDHGRKTLLGCFQHWEKINPQRTYLTQPYPDGRVLDYSWAEVGDQARRMAAHLKSLELPPKSNIALLGKNSAHWIMADLAIWMAGHVTVPLYPTLNAATAKYVLAHSEARLLFLGKLDGKTDGWIEMQQGIPQDLPLIGLPMSPRPDVPQWDDLIAKHLPLRKLHDPQTDELATIVYTSGSTGQPKGVMHSFGSMMAVSAALSQMYKLTSEDRMLSYLPLAHVAERAAVESTSLYFGFRVYFSGGLDTFQQDLKRAQPTVFFSVPRLWTKFHQAINQKLSPSLQRLLFALPVVSRLFKNKLLRELGLNHVRAAITGSAPLPSDIIAWYRKLGLELLDCYGMSENFGVSHASRPGQVRIGYVGSPAPGVTCRIDDNGELLVKSPGQMLGYYKMPQKTVDDLTPDGYFRTGDRGEIDSQQRLRITGRVKELFKTSKGKYVAPVPIEQLLGNHPKLEAVCVTGQGQPQPFGLLLLSPEARQELNGNTAIQADFATLLQQVNGTLEGHERLDYLVVVKDPWNMENGFLTPTMKIKRGVIEERYLPMADRWLKAGQTVIWE